MAAGRTYTPIATTTLTSISGVTFSSIPATYTDLILVISNATTLSSTTDIDIRFNGDTGGNYSGTSLWGTGSTAGSATHSGTVARVTYYGSATIAQGMHSITHIMNYANTSTYKTLITRASNANNGVNAEVNLWRSTAAINSITINALNPGTTFTLYGIAAA